MTPLLHPTQYLASIVSTMSTSRSGNVRCYLRIRPRPDCREEECLDVNPERRRVTVVDSRGETHRFSFDRVFSAKDSQKSVYTESVAPLVADFVSGRNCAVFSYGEKGSGKSHTILGKHSSGEANTSNTDDRSAVSSLSGGGISEVVKPSSGSSPSSPVSLRGTQDPPDQVFASKRTSHPSFSNGRYNKLEKYSPTIDEIEGEQNQFLLNDDSGTALRAAKQIFELMERKRQRGGTAENPILRCCIAQVYCETVIDLLDDQSRDIQSIDDAQQRESARGGVDVGRLEDTVCECVADVSQCIEHGLACQRDILRAMQADSTMVHLLIILKLERFSKSRGKRTTSHFFIGDLADAELVRMPPGNESTKTAQEAKSIKRALGSLRKCMHTLAMNGHSTSVPYMDTALTKLLRGVLVRGSGFSIFVAARSDASHVEATLSALRYGTYACGRQETNNPRTGNDANSSQMTRSTASSEGRTRHGTTTKSRGHGSESASHAKSISSDLQREASSLRKKLQELKDQNRELQRIKNMQADDLDQARREIESLSLAGRDHRTSGTSTTLGMDESMGTVNTGNQSQAEAQTGVDSNIHQCFENLELGPTPIRVCLRLRPLTKLETSRRSRSCIEVHEGSREFTVDSPLDGEYDFCFDRVFGSNISQSDVYQSMGAPIVSDVVAGINSSLVVYGLSGTGKKHTLLGTMPSGTDNDAASNTANQWSHDNDGPGISPRMITNLFKEMADAPETIEFTVTCSFVAIFLEKMYDLIEPRHDRTLLTTDREGGVYIEGASEAFCFDSDDALSLLKRGYACQAVIGNKLDIDAKRSHSIFVINVEQKNRRTREVRRSYLQVCQLAGFEVASKPKGSGAQETKIQHRSFAALGSVIKSLSEGTPCTAYNESKLTTILKDAVGGNCKTTFLVTASPSSYHISETINTIRLGQRIRRVTNYPHSNRESNKREYQQQIQELRTRNSEFSRLFRLLDEEMTQSSRSRFDGQGPRLWESIRNLVGQVESEKMGGSEFDKGSLDSAKRRIHTESLLADIQSEAVVLRRQNDLLVQDKRRKDNDLAEIIRENKLLEMQNSQLESKLGLAESRARESIEFLRYMRSLCWRLRKDIWKGRPIELADITSGLSGAPDLSGLVDLDRMMVDAGFIVTTDMPLEAIEDEFFNYLLDTGLIIDESRATEEEEFDELSGLDDGIRSERQRDVGEKSRWQGMRPPQYPRRAIANVSSASTVEGPLTKAPFRLQVNVVPWLRASIGAGDKSTQQRETNTSVSRYTSREWELQCDLHNMSDKCVGLQLMLNEQTQLVESLMNKSGSLQRKRLARDAVDLRRERDRMVHNIKAATWKLQELHVVNKLLTKQVEESKQQVAFLEEGFQKLQDSLRSSVHESLETETQLQDRVAALQTIADSLTGFNVEDKGSDEGKTKTRLFLPIRGETIDPSAGARTLIDPSSSESMTRSLTAKPTTVKADRKTPVFFVRSNGNHTRRSKRTGTAIAGLNRTSLERASRLGGQLVPPPYDSSGNDDSSFY